MLEFFRRLFAPEARSSDTAKERLRLVLLSDHLSLAPHVVEALKRDLLAVISRYLEIDPALADVTFEQRESEVAMLASIPIMGVRERSAPPSEMRPAAPSSAEAAPAAPGPAAPSPAGAPADLEPQPEDEAIMQPANAHATQAGLGSEADTELAGSEADVARGGSEADVSRGGSEADVSRGGSEADPAGARTEADAPPADVRVEALKSVASSEAGLAQHSTASARRRRRKKAAALANRPSPPLSSPGFGQA